MSKVFWSCLVIFFYKSANEEVFIINRLADEEKFESLS